MIAVPIVITLVLVLVGIAIFKRPFVKASLNLGKFGFSLEAKNNNGDSKHPS